MKLNHNFFASFAGQSLVEVVVALGVVAALAVALVTTSLVTQRTSQQAKNNTQATKLAQQTVEQVRVLRDRRGYSYLSSVSGACFTLDTSNVNPALWSLSACAGETANGEVRTLNNTDFRRKIAIATLPDTSNQRQVIVTAEWTDSGGVQKVTQTTILSNCVGQTTGC